MRDLKLILAANEPVLHSTVVRLTDQITGCKGDQVVRSTQESAKQYSLHVEVAEPSSMRSNRVDSASFTRPFKSCFIEQTSEEVECTKTWSPDAQTRGSCTKRKYQSLSGGVATVDI